MALEIDISRRRFTLDEYHRMGEVGILHEDDRVELIQGDIVQMTPIGSNHAAWVAALVQRFARHLGDRAIVWPQNPVVIVPDSEPQPDVVLLRPRPDFYRHRHPRPEDVLLLVEVADASLRYDRTVKLPLYAVAAIPEVWIVDVAGGAVEIYRDPTPGGYRRADRIPPEGSFSPAAFPDLVLSGVDIFG
jgi:Uma2 family endonuclease